MAKKSIPPTREQFTAYELMFAHFNRHLFGNTLPQVVLNFSRHARAFGFFAPDRWEQGKVKRHEISLNPSTLKVRKPVEVASTLVHEMVHLWQAEQGKPSRTGYHNKEWSDKMVAVGLTPSSTGMPGGKLVGQRMTHYITDGGPFAAVFAKMPTSYLLPWSCHAEPTKESKPRSKTRYSCPECNANVWGKPDLALACVTCSGSGKSGRTGGALVLLVGEEC